MKPYVCLSVEDSGGDRCVDILNDSGVFGFVECRRDPEDPSGWRHIGPVHSGFEPANSALYAARSSVGWMVSV